MRQGATIGDFLAGLACLDGPVETICAINTRPKAKHEGGNQSNEGD